MGPGLGLGHVKQDGGERRRPWRAARSTALGPASRVADELAGDGLHLAVVLQRAVVAARHDQQPLRLARRPRRQLLARPCRAPARRRARASGAARCPGPSRPAASNVSSDSSQGSLASRSQSELDAPPRAQAAQQHVLRRRADGHDGGQRGVVPSRAAAWIAWKPPMLEPRSATCGAYARASGRPSRARRRTRVGPKLARRSARARARRRRAPPCRAPRQPRAKSKWLSLAEPAPCRSPRRRRGSSSGRNSA